jgi:hypothetical protein
MTKLQSSKNGITGIMSNVHIKRQALKPHWNCIKSEMMRTVTLQL